MPLFDFDSGRQGIVHVIGPELGLTLPGTTIVCGDSHTSTHGAFGALAFGIGTTRSRARAGHAVPGAARSRRRCGVSSTGTLSPGVTAKDVALALIGAPRRVSGGSGYALEFAGPLVDALSMEERMTLCNMSIEAGARSALVAPDETTFAYPRGPAARAEGRRVDGRGRALADAGERSATRASTPRSRSTSPRSRRW